jgi:DNA-binding transcriptional LysR family regulator
MSAIAVNERLNGIAAFVQSVEAGSFAAAAKRMHLTRSAIGKSIARLERRLGVRLFHRTTRKQSLTEDGQAYYERCVRALAELDAGEAALDTGRRAPTGQLRVSAPVAFGRQCVAPVLLELAHKHSGLAVEISFTDRVVDLIEEGFDLAVRIGPLADSATLSVRRLGSQRMGICAAPSYLAARGLPRTVDELNGHTGIVYGRGSQVVPWRVRGLNGSVREPLIDSRLRFDDLQAIADAAVAGAGLAWLPCWLMAPHVRAGALTLVMDSEQVLATDIHTVWPRTRYLSAKMRAAIDALAAQIPAMMG